MTHNSSKRSTAAFTLAEMLAALLFMAIVIPTAVFGVQVANRAGQVGIRKAEALRIADRVLNELIATDQWQASSQGGVVQESDKQFQWTMTTSPWSEDAMNQISIRVEFVVQGHTHEVLLSTLVDPNENTVLTQ